MRISLVVAVSENGIIGAAGDLPWDLPDDQHFFKQLTTGHCILMGRGTYESIGQLLPKRKTIILSRNPSLEVPGAIVAHDFDEALTAASEQGAHEFFVVGGAAVYELALPVADRLYVTRVHADVSGDVRFPDFEDARYGCWKRVEESFHAADERHAHSFSFQLWERDAVRS